MKLAYLAFFLLIVSCNSSQKTSGNTTFETNDLLVELKKSSTVNDAKALITNSGLTWDSLVLNNNDVRIALVKVPVNKKDFWLKKLRKSGAFASVNLNSSASLNNNEEVNTPLFKIEKTPCFGDCPVFKVSINETGKVTYKGIENVLAIGVQEFQLSDKEFNTLKEKLEKNNFSSFQKKYDNPKIMDLPSTFISYNGEQIEVRLWSDEVPTELIDVKEYVEGILLDKKFFE